MVANSAFVLYAKNVLLIVKHVHTIIVVFANQKKKKFINTVEIWRWIINDF